MEMAMERKVAMVVEMEVAMEMQREMDMFIFRAQKANGRWLREPRRPVENSDVHHRNFGHQTLTFWRPLGHQEATKRAPRSARGGPKSRSIGPKS